MLAIKFKGMFLTIAVFKEAAVSLSKHIGSKGREGEIVGLQPNSAVLPTVYTPILLNAIEFILYRITLQMQ